MGKGSSCCSGPSSCAGTRQVFPEQHGGVGCRAAERVPPALAAPALTSTGGLLRAGQEASGL